MPTNADDPFRHHPGLRDQIADPSCSQFRALNTELIAQLVKEHNLPGGWWYSDEEREALRQKAMKGRWDRDLWVFGYGSLMWDPGVHFAEVRRARIEGYARRFIYLDIRGGRGTPEKPGLFAALDAGPGCEGLVFRIKVEDLEEETRVLWQREQIEPGYLPVFQQADIGGETVEALIFVADHSIDLICDDLSFETQVDYISTAEGVLGTSLDYAQGIGEKLEQLGINDPETHRLLEGVERRIAQNAAPE